MTCNDEPTPPEPDDRPEAGSAIAFPDVAGLIQGTEAELNRRFDDMELVLMELTQQLARSSELVTFLAPAFARSSSTPSPRCPRSRAPRP